MIRFDNLNPAHFANPDRHCCACMANHPHTDADGTGCQWCDLYIEITINITERGTILSSRRTDEFLAKIGVTREDRRPEVMAYWLTH